MNASKLGTNFTIYCWNVINKHSPNGRLYCGTVQHQGCGVHRLGFNQLQDARFSDNQIRKFEGLLSKWTRGKHKESE
jgi:hypothetical protein